MSSMTESSVKDLQNGHNCYIAIMIFIVRLNILQFLNSNLLEYTDWASLFCEFLEN